MSDFLNSEFESILAEAIERVESGEMIDAVIASYPAQYRDELNEILFVVDVVHQVSTEPVPMPSSERRAAAKQAFLASARESAAEDAAAISSAIDPISRLDISDTNSPNTNGRFNGGSVGHINAPMDKAASSPRSVRTSNTPSLFDQFADWVTQLLGLSPAHLAPIAAALLVAIMGVSSFYTVAWSVPGDIAYPFKEWTRKVQLDVVPVEERAALVKNHDESRAEELQTAQQRVDQVADEDPEVVAGISVVDLNDAVRTGSMRSIYHGRVDGDLMQFGAIDVLPRYQEDANVNSFTEIVLPEGQSLADLVEGVEVEIEYQMVPDAEQFVQGMRLRIVSTPPPPIVETPTSVPTPTSDSSQVEAATAPVVIAAPTATSTDRACIPSPRPGWASYYVVRNDTLSQIANKYNVSVEELARVNCILNPNRIVPGSRFNVPTLPVVDGGTPQGQQANPSPSTATSTPTSDLLPSVPTATLAPPILTQDDTPIPSLTIPAQPGTGINGTATAASSDEPTVDEPTVAATSTDELSGEPINMTATPDQSDDSDQDSNTSNPSTPISVTTTVTTVVDVGNEDEASSDEDVDETPTAGSPTGAITVTVSATLVVSPGITIPSTATAVPVATEPVTTTVPTGSAGSGNEAGSAGGDNHTNSPDGNDNGENGDVNSGTDVPPEADTPTPDAENGELVPTSTPEPTGVLSTPEAVATDQSTPDGGSVTTPDPEDENDSAGEGDSSNENSESENSDDGVADAGVDSSDEGNDGESGDGESSANLDSEADGNNTDSSGEASEGPATVESETTPPPLVTVQNPAATPTQESAGVQEPATTQEGAEASPDANNQEASDNSEPSDESSDGSVAPPLPSAPASIPTSTPAQSVPTQSSPTPEPTSILPTSTSVPPTSTNVPPPPTSTPLPPKPTATPPPTSTPLPPKPTATPPPTSTPLPPKPTATPPPITAPTTEPTPVE